MGEIIMNGESYSNGDGAVETSRLIKLVDAGQYPDFELLRFATKSIIPVLPITFRYSTNVIGNKMPSKVCLWIDPFGGLNGINTDVSMAGPGKLWYSIYQYGPHKWLVQILVSFENGGPILNPGYEPYCYIYDVVVPNKDVEWNFGPEYNSGTSLIGGDKTEIPLLS